MKNNLIRGIRKASDFLMALQLTGAFKREALPNLQARLPAVIIGGGLTAIDTATELMAFYPLQVEKTMTQYETLVGELEEARVRAMYDPEELELLDEYLAHGRAIRAERARAAAAGEPADFISLVRSWGGVTLAYRKRMVDSPAYRLNHEEVIKALEEGIIFTENINPIEAIPDERGALKAVIFKRESKELPAGQDPLVTLPARTMLVAAGTTPNIMYEKECAGTFQLDAKKKFFQPHVVSPGKGPGVSNADGPFRVQPDANGFFTSYEHEGKFVTYYGDNHPRYAGNVVKAMASAKDGLPAHPEAVREGAGGARSAAQPQRDAAWERLCQRLDTEFNGRRRRRRAPDADDRRSHRQGAGGRTAFPSGAVLPPPELRVGHAGAWPRGGEASRLLMEGIALTGAWVDKERGPALAHRARARRIQPPVRVLEEGRAGGGDGPDRNADRDSRAPERPAPRWRPRQCRPLLDRQGDARRRQPRHLFRRLQERRGPLQARGNRGGDRSGRLEHRHRGRHPAGAPAGLALPRQHRAGDARVPPWRARKSARPAADRGPHHRDRIGSHDGGGEGGAPRRACALISRRSTSASAASTRRCSA